MHRYLVAVALIFTVASPAFTADKDKDEDKKFPLNQLPAKVTAEAQRVAGKVEFEKAQRKEKDGYVYFKLEAVGQLRSYKFEITEQGETIKYEVKYEKEKEELTIEQLPAAVRDAAANAVKNVELKDAKRETRGPITTYEFQGKVDDRKFEITLSGKGKVIEVVDKDEERARKEAEKKAKELEERKKATERE